MRLKLTRSSNLRRVNRVRSVDHRCLFQAMGMRYRTKIGHVGTSGQGIKNVEVGQHLIGGQGHVGGPNVPLVGHVYEFKSLNWSYRDCRT